MAGKEKAQKRIYLDYAATTPVDPRVFEAMTPYFSKEFGNPGSVHEDGRAAKVAVLRARGTLARLLGVSSPDEIIFTGSGTESNNLAILGFAAHPLFRGYALSDLHFITSAIEHPSVLDCFRELERRGVRVSYLPVTPEGIVPLRAFEEALTPKTVFVSVMLANNEIGTVQPIAAMAKILAQKRKSGFFQLPTSIFQIPVFHTDASQAPLYLDVSPARLGVDLLTLDAQKVYGPKGIGLLYKKRGVEIAPILHGGSQEQGLRPGTENVPGIAGFAEAMTIAFEEREREAPRLVSLRDHCVDGILRIARGAALNGSATERLPNNVNISFPGRDAEWLALELDARGIAVGTRSACMSSKEPGSYVVAALGKGKEYATSSLRITLGRATTVEDIDALLAAFRGMLTK